MKKVIASVVAVGCLAAAGSAFAGKPAATGVNGSLHDMNTVVVAGGQDKMGRVCVYCHAPHHAVKDGLNNYPLWNHDLVDPTTYVGYTWATPANADAAGTVISGTDALIGPSRLCMSCHDGAIAIDQHGGAGATKMDGTMAQAGVPTYIANRAKLTNDLSNTHPIGFDYNVVATARNGAAGNGSASAGGASEIVPSTYGFATELTTISNTAGTYNVVKRGQPNSGVAFKPIKDALFQGQYMTCATCHEVHNKENAIQDNYANGYTTPGGETAPNYFLYAKENKSLICLSCHVK